MAITEIITTITRAITITVLVLALTSSTGASINTTYPLFIFANATYDLIPFLVVNSSIPESFLLSASIIFVYLTVLSVSLTLYTLSTAKHWSISTRLA